MKGTYYTDISQIEATMTSVLNKMPKLEKTFDVFITHLKCCISTEGAYIRNKMYLYKIFL